MSIAIRAAAPGDAAVVLGFIRELAEYEQLAHEVEATEASVEAALFCTQPTVFCDLAEWDGEAVGFALWFLNFSSFRGRNGIYLEDIFVRPGHRGHGVGKALLRHLARRCVARGWTRLEWAVLDWNAPSIEFYLAQGAERMADWTICRLSGDALRRLGEPAG